MKDLRFVFYTEQEINKDPKTANNKKLKKLIKTLNENGVEFNKKYSLITNIDSQQEIKEARKQKGLKYKSHWSDLKKEYLHITEFACPICSSSLQRYAHIDHYRPKIDYWWLTYNYENYIAICFDCNSAYKGAKFPLFKDKKKVVLSEFKDFKELNEKEMPLLINPLFDNPFEFFKLIIHKRLQKIEIIPKSKDKSSFEYQRACTTIEIFNLDDKKKDKKSDRTYIFGRIYFPLFNLAKEKDRFKKTKTENDYSKFKNKKKEVKRTLSNSWIGFIENDNYLIY